MRYGCHSAFPIAILRLPNFSLSFSSSPDPLHCYTTFSLTILSPYAPPASTPCMTATSTSFVIFSHWCFTPCCRCFFALCSTSFCARPHPLRLPLRRTSNHLPLFRHACIYIHTMLHPALLKLHTNVICQISYIHVRSFSLVLPPLPSGLFCFKSFF